MADVRVGIVSWNTAALLERCLASLPAALGDLDAEIVVVDNASSDASATVAERASGVRVVVNATNAGYAAAMDQALAGTDAPVLIALNPDTVLAPGSLAAAVAALVAADDVGLVVPRLHNVDGTLQHSVHAFPTIGIALVLALVPAPLRRGRLGRRLWLEGAGSHTAAADVDWAIGAVHVIRTAALSGAAPYSTRWFMYVEDLELCWRLHEAGWRVRYEPTVEVEHVGNAAGVQAWGGDRARRYWAASYDFIAGARGRPYARGLAAANLLAVLVHLVVNAVGAAAGPPASRGARRHAIAELRAALPAHVAALVRDPVSAAAWTRSAP